MKLISTLLKKGTASGLAAVLATAPGISRTQAFAGPLTTNPEARVSVQNIRYRVAGANLNLLPSHRVLSLTGLASIEPLKAPRYGSEALSGALAAQQASWSLAVAIPALAAQAFPDTIQASPIAASFQEKQAPARVIAKAAQAVAGLAANPALASLAQPAAGKSSLALFADSLSFFHGAGKLRAASVSVPDSGDSPSRPQLQRVEAAKGAPAEPVSQGESPKAVAQTLREGVGHLRNDLYEPWELFWPTRDSMARRIARRIQKAKKKGYVEYGTSFVFFTPMGAVNVPKRHYIPKRLLPILDELAETVTSLKRASPNKRVFKSQWEDLNHRIYLAIEQEEQPEQLIAKLSEVIRQASHPGDEVIKRRKLTDTTFIVFDFETNGFYPEVHRPIELGAVKFRINADGSIKVLGTYEQRMDPKMLLPSRITEHTGITPADLAGQPTLEQALPGFRAFVDADAVLLAHNAFFDTAFLGWGMKEFGVAPWPNLILDTKRSVLSLFPEVESARLKDLIALWNLRDDQEHRGLSDSWDTSKVFAKIAQRLAELRQTPLEDLTVGDLAQHSPNLHLDSILHDLTPIPVELERRRAIPDGFEQKLGDAEHRRHVQNTPGQLRDLSYALGYDYFELRDRLRAIAGTPTTLTQAKLQSLSAKFLQSRLGRFLFGNLIGSMYVTEKGRKIYVNPPFAPSLLTRIAQRVEILDRLSQWATGFFLWLLSKLPVRLARLAAYLRGIRSNGDLARIVAQWHTAKPKFTQELYDGLRSGKEEYYQGFDPQLRERVVAKFSPEQQDTPQELQLFLDSVTEFISTSLKQMETYYLWGLAHTILRHRANGRRHAERGVVPEYVPVIRQSIILAIRDQVMTSGGEWTQKDYKLWGTLFDRVWESMAGAAREPSTS